MNIAKDLDTLTSVVQAHESWLADEQQKVATQLSKQQADADTKLRELAKAGHALNTRLVELTSSRTILLEKLAIARKQLSEQAALVGDAERMIEGQFGTPSVGYGAGVWATIARNRADAWEAGRIVPLLKAWIAAREVELADAEQQIADLAQTAKPPAQ